MPPIYIYHLLHLHFASYHSTIQVIVSDALELPFPLSLNFSEFSVRWDETQFLKDPVGMAQRMLAGADVKQLQARVSTQ